MNDNTFWLGVWSIFGVTILGMALITADYYKQQDAYIVELVANGTDPIGAQCGLTDSMGDNPTCVLYLTTLGD